MPVHLICLFVGLLIGSGISSSQVRTDALEEAAKICEKAKEGVSSAISDGLTVAAHLIRARKDKN